MERELKRGTLELVLLKMLSRREMYGYEIVSGIDERAGGSFAVTDGTLYPVLYRLEKAGLVKPRWETQERGVPRKYYRVTGAGSQQMRELEAEWRAFTGAVDRLLEEDGETGT